MKVRHVMTAAFMAGALMIAENAVQAAPDNTLGMALMSASVDPDGTLVRGSGVTSAARISAGTYDITFERDLTTCTWIVSPGTNTFGGSVGGAFAEADGRAGTTDRLFVQLKNTAAAVTDLPFHLLVFCPE